MGTEDELLSEAIESTDKEIFDSAMATEPPGEEPALAADEPEPAKEEAKPDEPARDEQGRFVAKDKEEPKLAEPAKQETPADDDKQGQIPSWRLREEREAKAEALKALELEKGERAKLAAEMDYLRRQFAQSQKAAEQPPEPEPDPLLDPKGFRDHLERTFNERLLNQQRDWDMRAAHRQHGKVFEEAYAQAQVALANGDVQLRALMHQTATPGDTLIQWHQQRQILRDVGSDPAAYKTKLLEEALKDPAYLAKAIEAARAGASVSKPAGNSAGRPAVELPPSLAGAARADASANADDDNDVSDAALFRHAMRR